VVIKANFNSADQFPASTHIDTLDTVSSVIAGYNPARFTLAERSGMGSTGKYWSGRGFSILHATGDLPSAFLMNLSGPGGRRYRLPECTGDVVFFSQRILLEPIAWSRSAV